MSTINISCDSTMIPDPRKYCWCKIYTTDVGGVLGFWCLQSHVRDGFFAMLACLVMTISRRSEDFEIKTKIFGHAVMSRGGKDFQES